MKDKIGSESGPFTKIGDLKTDPSQKSETLNIKNYNVIFHYNSGANAFARKNFTKLHFSKKKKIFFHKDKNIFYKNKKTFSQNYFFFSQNYK